MEQTRTPHVPVGTPPTLDQLRAELEWRRYQARYYYVLFNTVFTLVVVAAFAVLTALLWMPVLEIYGASMTPTLEEGEIVVTVKNDHLSRGDVVGFYIGNKLLVKRCIGLPGDVIIMNDAGDVYVNGERLVEPYVSEKSLGECDLEFPYVVPQESFFLLGDHRATSVDSRSSVVGCMNLDQFASKIVFRIWPLNRFGPVGGD